MSYILYCPWASVTSQVQGTSALLALFIAVRAAVVPQSLGYVSWTHSTKWCSKQNRKSHFWLTVFTFYQVTARRRWTGRSGQCTDELSSVISANSLNAVGSPSLVVICPWRHCSELVSPEKANSDFHHSLLKKHVKDLITLRKQQAGCWWTPILRLQLSRHPKAVAKR